MTAYSTAQVLTMTTGTLLCDLGDVYAIASGLLGRSVFTHELPAAMRECKPWILAHHPQLEAITGDDVTPSNVWGWVAARERELGTSFDVPPLTYSATAEKSPIETAVEMFGPERVIAVDLRDGDA